MTPVLEGRVISKQYIALQRNEARKKIGEFVQNWVLGQEKWKSLKDIRIQVFFDDESDAAYKAGYSIGPYKQ